MRTRAKLPWSGSTVEGEAEHVARAVAIDCDFAERERQWVAELRAQGVKAAHPDDGWHDRVEHKVHLCYPQFNDGLKVGDLFALGSAGGPVTIVRVTGTSEMPLGQHIASPWYFHYGKPSDSAAKTPPARPASAPAHVESA